MTKEKVIETGLRNASNRKEAEYDLVNSLLAACEYKTEEVTEVEIRRNGKFLFKVFIHPLSEKEVRQARKKATTYMKNPQGKNLPLIEKNFDAGTFKSWMIYLASTEDTQQQIWGNPAVMQAKELHEPWESVDYLLKLGEKNALLDKIFEISGMNEDGEVVDQEEFQHEAD